MMYFKPRKNFTLNDDQKPSLDALELLITKLNARDAEFASSLVANFYRFGQLTDRQFTWVNTLTERANNPTQPKAAEKINLQAITDLMDTAAQRLRHVRVSLKSSDDLDVVFTRAGSRSKYNGQIMITDGGPFGQNVFYGRIDTNGDFFPTRAATEAVRALVREFAIDPAGTAGRYGRLTGGCSFCSRPLKDSRSLAVGYGPVCAKNYGLKFI